MRSKSRYPKRDIHQEVTDRIIESLEKGLAPWQCPWTKYNIGRPRNGLTGRPYSGINTLILWATANVNGYRSNEWFTFIQACEALGLQKDDRGRYIPEDGKGVASQKSTPVVYYERQAPKKSDKKGTSKDILALLDDEADDEKPSSYFRFRHYNVWNRDQIAGLPPQEPPIPMSEWERIEQAEAVLRGAGAKITEGGNRACYRADPLDDILLPSRGQFSDSENYYSTAFHELIHWTGAPSRLARPMAGKFGTAEYAEEELVAELGAAFICADLEFSAQLQHAEYIGSWLEKLRNDKKYIFRASAQATRAVDFLNIKTSALETEAAT